MLREIIGARTLARNDKNCERQKAKVESLVKSIDGIEPIDAELQGEFDFYKGLPEVEMAEDTKFLTRANSDIQQAVTQVKTLASTLKSKFSSLLSYQSSLVNNENRQISLTKNLREARKKRLDAMPFSQAAKQAKEQIANIRSQKSHAKRQSTNLRTKISEITAEIGAKKDEIEEKARKATDTQKWRQKAKPVLKKQFQIVDKIKAKYQFFKHVADLNDPNIDPAAKKQAIQFCQLYDASSQKFTISLSSPLREYSAPELQAENKRMQAGEELQLNQLVASSQNVESTFKTTSPRINSVTGQKIGVLASISACIQQIEASRDKKIAEKQSYKSGPLPDFSQVR